MSIHDYLRNLDFSDFHKMQPFPLKKDQLSVLLDCWDRSEFTYMICQLEFNKSFKYSEILKRVSKKYPESKEAVSIILEYVSNLDL